MIQEVFYKLETFIEEQTSADTIFLVKPLEEWLLKNRGNIFLFSNVSLGKLEIFWGNKKVKEFINLQTILGAQYAYLLNDVNFSVFSFENTKIKVFYTTAPTEIDFYLNYSLPPNYIVNIYETKQKPC